MEGASTVQLVEMIDGGAFYFYHQTDDVTMTSDGILWVYPGKQPIQYSVAVLPETNKDDVSKCYGICSDIIETYKNE